MFTKEEYDISGQKFNFLTVIKQTKREGKVYIEWECLCDCGNISYVTYNNLTSNRTKSCGCRKRKRVYQDVQTITRYAKSFFTQTKKHAVGIGCAFLLSFKQVLSLAQLDCFYCGQESVIPYKLDQDIIYLNGLDRLANDKGYTDLNTVSCCAVCNFMKGSLPWQLFLQKCAQIAIRHGLARPL